VLYSMMIAQDDHIETELVTYNQFGYAGLAADEFFLLVYNENAVPEWHILGACT